MNRDPDSEHIIRVLVEAVAFLAAFLELSDDDLMDPDAAAKQMENLGGILQQLTPLERSRLLQYIHDLAGRYAQEPGYDEFTEFLRYFGEGFGLRQPREDAEN